jgi:hypothetical protein
MSDAPGAPAAAPATPSEAAPSPKASIAQIFGAFLMVGVTSFGGGVVAYLAEQPRDQARLARHSAKAPGTVPLEAHLEARVDHVTIASDHIR